MWRARSIALGAVVLTGLGLCFAWVMLGALWNTVILGKSSAQQIDFLEEGEE